MYSHLQDIKSCKFLTIAIWSQLFVEATTLTEISYI